MQPPGPASVLICSPIDAHLVKRIEDSGGDRVRVVYEPGLLPTPRYPGDHNGIPRSLDPPALKRWRAHLSRADVLFDFDWMDPAGIPVNAPRVRWVQATSSGIGEFLVSTRLAESGITFTTAAGVHAVPLAEFVVLGLLYVMKRVPYLRTMQAEHRWERYTTRQLAGQRALVIGLGNVGRHIARTLAGLGMEVSGMSRTDRTKRASGVTRMIRRDGLEDALSGVDALVLSCPYTPETHHLIGAPQLASMRHDAVLVNVSRGAVVDQAALTEALRQGRLAGAVLDVFEKEPLPPEDPLWDLPNVLVSPHSASTVDAENAHIVDLFVENLGRYLEGRPLINRFERDRGY
jgi:phosphoglycerate dehydrogenase-like enzyme